MNKKILVAILVPLMGMSVPMSTFADDNKPSRMAKRTAVKNSDAVDMRASKLIGKEVMNAKDENLGEIKDLIVDLKGERVHYAILSFGGALGVGDKLMAYPVKAFKSDVEGDKLVLNVSEDMLKRGPTFEKDRWPDWSNDDYRRKVDRHFRNDAKVASGVQMIRASELMGKDVDDRNGKDAGEVTDLVVNLGTGRIRYAVLEFDKAWSLNDKLVALPMKAFTLPRDSGDDLVVNVTSERLKNVQSFDKDKWPDMRTAEYRRTRDENIARFEKNDEVSSGK